MNMSFETIGAVTYLVYTFEPKDEVDSFSYGMISNNQIPHIAPIQLLQKDEKRFFKYNISSKVSVDQYFTGQVTRKRLLSVFSSMANALLAAEDYMIEPSSFIYDLEYVYADVSSGQADMICLPLKDEKEAVDLSTYFKNILFNTQFDQSEDASYVAELINLLNSMSTFSLTAFRDKVSELLNRPKPAAATQNQSKAHSTQPETQQPYSPQPAKQPQQTPPAHEPKVQAVPQPQQAPKQQTPVSQTDFAVPGKPAQQAKAPTPKTVTEMNNQNPAPAPGVLLDEDGTPLPPLPKMTVGKALKSIFIIDPEEKALKKKHAAAKKRMLEQQKNGVVTNQASVQQEPKLQATASVQASPGQENGEVLVDEDGTPLPPLPKMTVGKALKGIFIIDPEEKALKKKHAAARKRLAESRKNGVQPGQVVPGAPKSFAVPGQPAAPPVNKAQENQTPAPQQKAQQPPQETKQPQAPQAEQQPQQPQHQQPAQAEELGFGQNGFGETTVLGGGTAGETTVLGQQEAAGDKPVTKAYLLRRKNNEKIFLDKQFFRLGKERNYVDYCIQDNSAISRSHASLHQDGENWLIEDTNSLNHTYVNGEMIPANTKVPLKHGATIMLANEAFEFRMF